MALKRLIPALLAGCLLGPSGVMSPALAASDAPPAATDAAGKEEALVYIFSGVVTGGGETYSGTLVATPEGPELELKFGGGATCDGHKLEPDKGLLRLPETACSDGRKLKALFVYQAGGVLRVYGSIGDQRFSTQAHALPSGAAPSAGPTDNAK
ncbi:MAG: hypothetical protein P4L76_05855 [Beijerinckiaceae bacterium]|nr:hypothetical protein [Beijerinckiaceae bacterium]